MVFRGRPSKACFACRGRRIKCDRKKPGCNQCLRMRIPCPGYPDPLEQSYRDQSSLVIRKAEASYKRISRHEAKSKPYTSSSASLGTPTEPEDSGSDCITGALCQNPSLHLDTIAVTEFMSSYIPQSPYDYLSAISHHQSAEASISVTVRAVSLAMTASKLKSSEVLGIARRLYTTALSDTNAALRDPNTATEDSTLVSVLLLGLFEALACQFSGPSSNWATHTAGAAALLRLRGKEQLCSILGRRLLEHVLAILTFDTFMRKVHLTPDVMELVSFAEALHYRSPKIAFVKLTAEITDPPCVLWDCDMLPIERATKALWLDERVVQFTQDLPVNFGYQEWKQETHSPLKSGWDTHGYTIHQYQHHHAARMWNASRVLRIMLNSVAHRALSQLPSSTPMKPQIQNWKTALRRAASNINQSATEICASVPQILNPTKYDKLGIEAPPEARVATLLSALSVVKAESLAPQTTRAYATDRLKYLGREFNVPQAESAAAGEGINVLHSGLHMFYVY